LRGGASQFTYHFSRINRSARHFLHDAQLAGVTIIPEDRRPGLGGNMVDLPHAWKCEVAVEAQILDDSGDASQDVTKASHVSSSGFGKGETSGMTTGAGAHRFGFKDSDALAGIEHR